jgi:hypothetical protein
MCFYESWELESVERLELSSEDCSVIPYFINKALSFNALKAL